MPSCPAPFLQAVDETGAVQTVGADDFVLEFRGRASVWGDIADNQDGTYSVRVIAEEQDYFATFMSIMLDGQHIEGSPVRLTVVPAGLFNMGAFGAARAAAGAKGGAKAAGAADAAAAASFACHGAALLACNAGDRAAFEIISRREGEAAAPDDLTVELRGADFVRGSVERSPAAGAGVFVGRYVATVAGRYVLSVKVPCRRFRSITMPGRLRVGCLRLLFSLSTRVSDSPG